MTRITDVAREALACDEKRTPGDWRATKGRQAASVVAKDCAIYINVDPVVIADTVKRWQADAAFVAFSANNLRALAETVLAWAPIVEAAKEWQAAERALGEFRIEDDKMRLRKHERRGLAMGALLAALSALSKEPGDEAG